MYRNIAGVVEFLAVDTATGLPKTGDAANITAYVSIDGGAVTALGDTSATELSSTNAKGVYRFDHTAAEANGKHLLFSGKSSTSGVEIEPIEIWTRTPPLAIGTAQAGASGSITLAAGESSVTDFHKQCLVKIIAGTGIGQARLITAYNGTTKVATVNRNWATNPDNTSIYEVWEAESADPVNVDAILTDTGTTLDARIPAALVGGRMDANVGAISADAVAADNAEAFFDGTGYAGTNNVIPSVTTVTGNVNGSVASVTGSVGGNVVGSVGSVAAGGITASSIAADAIGASELAADAVAEIADGVWDELRLGHTGLGTFGQGVASVQGNVTGTVASVTGNVDGNVTGSVGSVVGAVGSVTGAVGSVAAGGITASSIATGAIDADALAADAGAELATAILDLTDGIETSYTLRQALRLILSAAAAKLSGAATTTIAIRDINDTKDRITATVDASGNRTAVTKDVS